VAGLVGGHGAEVAISPDPPDLAVGAHHHHHVAAFALPHLLIFYFYFPRREEGGKGVNTEEEGGDSGGCAMSLQDLRALSLLGSLWDLVGSLG